MTLPRIPQADPRADYLACQAEIDAAVRRVFARGQYILGPEVAEFEKEFAQFLGADFVVGCASGTDALELALAACGVGAGDEVVTVSHTAVATVAAISRCGAHPVLVDVEPGTCTMDPAALAQAITPRCKAVVPVHLYGQCADLSQILPLAWARGLRVIEDCAQAHGALCRVTEGGEWQRAGTAGDCGAFSFYPTKNLGALGDGGGVATNDPELARRMRLLREYGWEERYVSQIPGRNSRLDEVQAAILRVKLRRLDEWNSRRQQIAAAYDQLLEGTALIRPARAPRSTHVFHQYVVQLAERDRIRSALQSAGVMTSVHYPVPVHLQPAYASLAAGTSLPVTERLCSEVLSLPIYPGLTDLAVERVAAEFISIVRRST